METELDYFTERERVREHSADGVGERARARAHASQILSRSKRDVDLAFRF